MSCADLNSIHNLWNNIWEAAPMEAYEAAALPWALKSSPT